MIDPLSPPSATMESTTPIEDIEAAPAGSIVLLVGSSGGHLDHLVRLEPWWRETERVWVTFDLPDARSRLAEERTYWAFHPTTRNVKNLVRNLWLARKILREVRPDVVVSTGAGLALPFFLLARLHRAKTVYLEVFDRVATPTLTGRLCRPLSDLFLVQWREQQRLYPGSVYVGSVYP